MIGAVLALLLVQQPEPMTAPPSRVVARPLPPGDWRHVDWQGPLTVFYDAASIRPVEGRLSVRILGIGDFEGTEAEMIVGTVELDCVNNSGTLVGGERLDGAGMVIDRREIPPAERRALPSQPGGLDERVQRLVCAMAR